ARPSGPRVARGPLRHAHPAARGSPPPRADEPVRGVRHPGPPRLRRRGRPGRHPHGRGPSGPPRASRRRLTPSAGGAPVDPLPSRDPAQPPLPGAYWNRRRRDDDAPPRVGATRPPPHEGVGDGLTALLSSPAAGPCAASSTRLRPETDAHAVTASTRASEGAGADPGERPGPAR